MPPAVLLDHPTTTAREPAPDPQLGALVGFVGLGLAVGAVGAASTASGLRGWYQRLQKPPFNPPSWVFGPVWTTLYVLMGTSAWRLWRKRERPEARALLGLWGGQLALNAAWSELFFRRRRPDAAMADLVALWGAIGTYAVQARKVDRTAAALFVPYVAWVTFAAVLNAEIWRRNR